MTRLLRTGCAAVVSFAILMLPLAATSVVDEPPAPVPTPAPSPSPSVPTPNSTTVPTPAPTPNSTVPTKPLATAAPVVPPTPQPTKHYDTPEPTSTEPYPEPEPHHTSIGRMIARTLGWLIILALSALCFGAIMSNRYRIYYALRGLWYAFLRLDCTRWIIRKVRYGRNGGPQSNTSLNEIIFDQNDLQEGLLLNSST